ncbi:MAG: general secretion pathway protein C [Methylibium sp.]|nr:general secretion pathway protein C [Methylibium sp.]
MPVRLLSFFVWALLACSAVFWAMQLLARPLPVPAHALAAGDGAAPRGDLARLLGSTPANAAPEPVLAAPDARFRLLGVVSPKAGAAAHRGEGVALISVDGAPARAVRLGAAVDGDLQLLALDARSASLGQGGVTRMTLRLEEPAAAATGTPSTAVLVPAAAPIMMPPAVPAPAEATPPPPRADRDGAPVR